jgi:hypothetical protein
LEAIFASFYYWTMPVAAASKAGRKARQLAAQHDRNKVDCLTAGGGQVK